MRNRESPASHQALQRRLRVLAERYSLSEIARRTGTPLASVSRYFRGTRVPAGFCGELATHFGVNPIWLLTGEGVPWTTNVPGHTSAMAGDLLKLVEAMNSVAHARLGALTGKNQLRMLRDLDDALHRFESLRRRLKEHAEPVLSRLLEDIDDAMNRTDVDRAAELHSTIGQVRRFCDAPDLEYRVERACAKYELMRRNPQAALRHQQRVFRLSMGDGLFTGASDLEEAIRLAFLLAEAGREQQALSLCLAALELVPEQGKQWESYPFLAFLTGHYMTNHLRLFEGIERMQRWQPHVTGATRVRATRHMLAFALLYAGLVQPDEAFDFGGESEVKAMNLLYFAIYRADAGYLRRALKYRDKVRGQSADLAPLAYVEDYARLLAEVRSGGDEGGRFDRLRRRALEHPQATTEQELHVFETQLLRLLGRAEPARRALCAAEAAITRPVRPARTLLLVRALHYRNALELGHRDLRREARRFFEAHRAAGYQALRAGSDLAVPKVAT
ncbi:MAG: hypothetical protein HS108_08165 [Planctomycetes bacterium]|nr:hypothetical protein [Planctomycetota bacterium]MCL4731769.1 hypothetical protein [Planctomycetota bacterium]